MNKNEIKKALYKQKPIAEYGFERDNIWHYSCEVVIDNTEKEITFEVPVSEMGENRFDKEIPAQLLIRWIV